MTRLRRASCILALLLLPAAASAAGAQGGYASDEALRHYLAGRWMEEIGDLPGAAAEFARAMALDPDAVPIQVEACLVASRTGEPQRALELAIGALAREPRNARALWLQGAALVSLAKPAEALTPLRMAVDADPLNAEAWRTLAGAAESVEAVELQDSCYSRLVALDEDDAESWFQLATTRARLERFESADSALSIAIEANPARPGALFMRGWIRERLGRADEAADLYLHHLQVHRDDLATRRRLVGLLARGDRVKEGLEQARLVTAAKPSDATAYQVQADLEFRAKQPDQALRTLARMRDLAPDDPGGVARTAEVLVRYNRAREAVRIADTWASTRTTDSHATLLRAWTREAAGQLDSALAYARLAVAAQPDSEAPRRLLARYLRQSRQWSEAITEIERLRSANPGDPSLLLDLGFCREQSGDVPGAIQAGRDALRMAPDAPPTLNFLGYILADHDRDLAEAEQLIRRAIEQDPDNGAYLDSMGWLLFRRGEFASARSQLERALVLTGGDPVIHEHLGDVYRELKLPDLAREQYRRSLEGDTGNSRVRGKLEAVR